MKVGDQIKVTIPASRTYKDPMAGKVVEAKIWKENKKSFRACYTYGDGYFINFYINKETGAVSI